MDRKLVLAAATLRRQSLEGFQGFVEAFRVFADEQCDACIRAPAEHLVVAQGRAQNCMQILRLLETCHIEAAKYEK
jgi:hypothetical protein